MGKATSAAIGAVLAVATDIATERAAPRHRTTALTAGLVAAAAIYPIARSRRPLGAPLARELAGLGATGAIGSLAARSTPSRARRLVATGWATHAVFDMVHDRGADSRIPSWYPAMCAGYDLAIAGRLVAG
jgi:hypothetical protein